MFGIFGRDDDDSNSPITDDDLAQLHSELELMAEQIEERRLSVDDRVELSKCVMTLLGHADEATSDEEEIQCYAPDTKPTTDQIAKDVRDLTEYLSHDRFLPSASADDIQQMRNTLGGIQQVVEDMEEFDYAYVENDRNSMYGEEIQSIGIPDEINPDELDPGQDGEEIYAAGSARRVLETLPREHDDAPLFVGKGTRNGRDASIEKNHLFRHRAIFGVTGYGKSTLLTNDARQLIESGAGLCFIDPKGDDARRLMKIMPEHRVDDVVWIEPGATGDYLSGFNFISLNMDPDSDEYNAALASLVEDLKKMLAANDDYWGPRMDRVAQSIITGMNLYNSQTPDDAPEMNFVDMYYVLKSEASRHEFTARLKEAGLRFITPHMETVAEMPEDDLEPLLGRFLPWIQNPVARRMIGFRSGGVSIPNAIDNDKIIIVRMGSEPRELKQMLGMAVIRRIWSHIRGRAAESEHQRSPFYLFADEFDNLALADDTIPAMISESRSYRLAMTLANQYPDQLPSNVIDAITTNCDTIMSFNPGDKKSARTYCTQLGLDPDDLTEEVNYHYWMRTTISENMERSDAFRVYAYPPFPPVRDVDARDAAIRASLKKVGRERRSDEEVYQNLLFNEGEGRWETGIGQQIAMADEKEEKLYFAQQLQQAVPEPEDPSVSGESSGGTTAGPTTPMAAGSDGAGSPGETAGAFGRSTPDDAESVVERHLDTVLESIFAARLQAGKQPGEYVSVNDAKDELVARLEDSTVDSLSELSNIYERINSSYADDTRKDGVAVIKLTPEGRGIVLQQDTGSAGSGGGDDHRWILGQSYVAFTQIGYVSWLPEQEGEEMPDGVAKAPIDVTDVDEDLSPTEKLEAMEERREQLREEYPGVWNFAGADNVAIEAETSTIKYPFQTFTNLRKAREKGEMCVFAVKDGSANHGSFTYWGERAEKVIYETEGTRHGAEVVSDEITFRKSPGPDGNPRYYNDGGGDYRVGDDKIALRERRPEDDKGQGNMGTIWYKDKETGEVIAAAGTAEKIADDGEIARFEDEEAAQNGDKTAVPAYYEYDKSDGEYIVYNDGEKEFYPSKEELEAHWVPFRGPFLPTERFDTDEEEDDLPSDEDFEIIIFPDGDNDEYDQPQLYHRGECTPLFDHLGVESVDDVDAGEIEGPGEVEDATTGEPVDEDETEGDGEADNGENSEKTDPSADSPASDGPTVEGFEKAPTPARIASDEQTNLTIKEITDAAEGEYTPSKQQQAVLLTLVNSLTTDPEYMATTPEEAIDQIVVPEEANEGDDEGVTQTGERGEEPEKAADENGETIGTSPKNPGLSVPGYHTAPTPTEIVKDDRLDLTAEEVAAIARGERDMTPDDGIMLQSILMRLAEGSPEYAHEDIPGEITVPVDGVGAYADDTEAADTDNAGDSGDRSDTASGEGENNKSQSTENDESAPTHAQSGTHDDPDNTTDTEDAQGEDELTPQDGAEVVTESPEPNQSDTGGSDTGVYETEPAAANLAGHPDGQNKTAERGQKKPEETSRSEPTTEPDQTTTSSETEPDEDVPGGVSDQWDSLIDTELSDSKSAPIQNGGPFGGAESEEASQDQPDSREDTTEDETEQEQEDQEQDSEGSGTDLGQLLD